MPTEVTGPELRACMNCRYFATDTENPSVYETGDCPPQLNGYGVSIFPTTSANLWCGGFAGNEGPVAQPRLRNLESLLRKTQPEKP